MSLGTKFSIKCQICLSFDCWIPTATEKSCKKRSRHEPPFDPRPEVGAHILFCYRFCSSGLILRNQFKQMDCTQNLIQQESDKIILNSLQITAYQTETMVYELLLQIKVHKMLDIHPYKIHPYPGFLHNLQVEGTRRVANIG